MSQLPLNPEIFDAINDYPEYTGSYRENLLALLDDDLDFHGQSSRYSTHDLHAFPAKFPPQLPRKFIRVLTEADDLICDPMSGSGTTLLEAYLAGRNCIALDIDPLALLLARVKTRPMPVQVLIDLGAQIIETAQAWPAAQLDEAINQTFDKKTRDFLDYWFSEENQRDLMALRCTIKSIEDDAQREFMWLVFSAIIITKSGGVSLARDLAHTRPHKVTDRKPRDPFNEFRKRLKRATNSLSQLAQQSSTIHIGESNAQNLPLADNSIDLIVTSPPYAANAIDYMRAHKFSLSWMGYPVTDLSKLRRDYIGGESTTGFTYEDLPEYTENVVNTVATVDEKKGRVLRRYYSEMTRCLLEIHRVLKPGKAAVVVVGSSTMRGIDTQTHECLADIGRAIALDVPKIGVRHLDRDRRMMPARRGNKRGSQIEERMHEEYVIGFVKPEGN